MDSCGFDKGRSACRTQDRKRVRRRQCRSGNRRRLRLRSRRWTAARRRAGQSVATRRASLARPIATRIMRCAICPPAAPPSGGKLSEIEALAKAVGGTQGRAGAAARRPACCGAWTALRGHFRAPMFIYCSDRTPMASNREPDSNARHARACADARPTPERRQQGRVERLDRHDRGYRRASLAALSRGRYARRSWNGAARSRAGMRQAGEDFRARFARRRSSTRYARSTCRICGSASAASRPDNDGPALRIEAARDAVWRAIQAVGGIASPAGSCVWHVVGWECSLKEWALEQGWSGRRVSQESASGILVAALGALEAHFGRPRSIAIIAFLLLTNPDRSAIRSPH